MKKRDPLSKKTISCRQDIEIPYLLGGPDKFRLWWKYHAIHPTVKTDGSLTIRLNTTENSSLFQNIAKCEGNYISGLKLKLVPRAQFPCNLKSQNVNFFQSSFQSNFWPCRRYSRQAATTLTTLNFPSQTCQFFGLNMKRKFFGLVIWKGKQIFVKVNISTNLILGGIDLDTASLVSFMFLLNWLLWIHLKCLAESVLICRHCKISLYSISFIFFIFYLYHYNLCFCSTGFFGFISSVLHSQLRSEGTIIYHLYFQLFYLLPFTFITIIFVFAQPASLESSQVSCRISFDLKALM